MILCNTWASLVAQMVKNLPGMQETRVQSLGREDPLEKRMATHSQCSCLVNSVEREAWWGSQRKTLSMSVCLLYTNLIMLNLLTFYSTVCVCVYIKLLKYIYFIPS